MTKKVLIIDDDVEYAEIVSNILKERDYETLIATDGLQAIEKSKMGGIDLILLDIRMPFFSGLWFCDAFKQREETQDIPVVIVSGFLDAENIQKAYRVGACAYLKKPFESDELLSVIEKHLSGPEHKKFKQQ